ncbi:MGDG synthase family glycosyltransferase [Brachyspira pilosicoli]|uniref:MGDG synthase family glycosyltransferase n=1 Tax=Brachyspira pilosicoli TaxID=52584 RepID=UPI00255CFBF0|nr:galactosyldiacylglycerol synthase [Brachyspira pilosicoli]
MKKILIISSEYTGHGHKSVDTALLQYFKLKYKDKIECKVINGFKLGNKKLKQIEMLYNPCIKYLPNLWEKIFFISNKNSIFFNKNTSKNIQKKFIKLINSYEPNLILSVHPMFNGSILNILERNNIHIKFYTLITDLVSVSRIWLDIRTNKIISPSKEATEFIINNGIDKDKILTFGIPVRNHFISKYKTIDEIRANTNFNNKLRILILNNTEKSKRIFYMIKNIHEKFDCDITVVCGRNKNSYIRIKNRLKNYDKPVNIIGYTKELFNLFYNNDVLITRCGTLSVVEAINCIIPIISMGALPGQEEDTPLYLENNNLGYDTSSTDDIFNKINLLLENNRERLLKIREAQFNYYGRDVTPKIVEYIANQLIND